MGRYLSLDRFSFLVGLLEVVGYLFLLILSQFGVELATLVNHLFPELNRVNYDILRTFFLVDGFIIKDLVNHLP